MSTLTDLSHDVLLGVLPIVGNDIVKFVKINDTHCTLSSVFSKLEELSVSCKRHPISLVGNDGELISHGWCLFTWQNRLDKGAIVLSASVTEAMHQELSSGNYSVVITVTTEELMSEAINIASAKSINFKFVKGT